MSNNHLCVIEMLNFKTVSTFLTTKWLYEEWNMESHIYIAFFLPFIDNRYRIQTTSNHWILEETPNQKWMLVFKIWMFKIEHFTSQWPYIEHQFYVVWCKKYESINFVRCGQLCNVTTLDFGPIQAKCLKYRSKQSSKQKVTKSTML